MDRYSFQDRDFQNVIRAVEGLEPLGSKTGKRNRRKSKRDPRRVPVVRFPDTDITKLPEYPF